jgi:S-adenosylmethionine-diacylgycerolhomoserine-N-methlytransferase
MDSAHRVLLDRNYRYQRHVYDATRAFFLLGRDRLIRDLEPPQGGSILEIGCGTARNLRRLAATYPCVRLYGLDLSGAMLATAERKLAGDLHRPRILLAHGDAATFNAETLFGRSTFDRIFFSYSLSMIPPWQAALEHAMGLLSPFGSMHIVDFGMGAGLQRVVNFAFLKWIARFHVEPRDNLLAEIRRLAIRRGAEVASEPMFNGYAVYALMMRSKGTHLSPMHS